MSEADFIPLEEPRGSKGAGDKGAAATLFVSSLPYNATSTDLITHFSFIGPIRHGFVATDRETGNSKGVGYVTYSMREDAERAIEELDNKEFGGKGRKIRVGWADQKLSMKERKEAQAAPRQAKKPRVAAGEESTGPSDPNAIRTLILSGLPADLTKAVLWKKVRKANDKAELVYPIEGEENVNTANIIFPSHGDALKALPKLHGHTYKGAILSCVLKKRLDKLSTKGEGRAASHAGRLIVRNLAWDTTEADLRATFLPFGPLVAIDLPTAPSKIEGAPPRARGFAFVWFMVRKDAERAMEAVNGKAITRAPDAAVAKGKKGREAAKARKVDDDRLVAVDWALSKDKWQETQPKEEEKKEEAEESGSESEGEASGSGSGSGSESGEEGSDDEDEEEDNDEDVEMAEGDEDEDEDEEEAPIKPRLPDTDVGSTLFIRNLPFETTEQELGTLFRTFGPIRYARITIDKATGRSRGTGFVCYWNSEHADEAITESERVAQETGANAMPLGDKKNPFALPSVLTADPSSSLASKLVLHGRTLAVSRAVTREQAGNLKEDAERAREKGDKRNTYLMREGVVFPNSPAAAALPSVEVEKRQAAFNARKALLRSNPALYVSKTRLSIRQLPLFLTDRGLKRLGIHAVRTFDAEVAAGTREPLSRVEETDSTLSPALEARAASGKGPKRGERQTAVVQSKVVRQNEKVDPLTNSGRSKGYGFLELRSHKEALKVLRWANNNATVGPLVWEWWVAELGELRDRAKAQLERARAGEKEKESVEELEARLKKIDARLAEGDDRSQGGMRGGKTLLIEFSIENAQVVRRRVDKQSHDRPAGAGGKRKADAIAAEDTDDEDAGAGGKRQRTDKKGGKGKGKFDAKDKSKSPRKDRDARGGDKRDGGRADRPKRERRSEATVTGANAEQPRGIEKLGSALGSMIGRKRKQRKGGK
ncbi:RNA recognition motif-containing protein [Vanrija albida]|uniref:RNA recognition motif-containing protein n=1 Tax=Vanrija albida TaxID=181172 RepID=A0ABR3Q1F5_9TREE